MIRKHGVYAHLVRPSLYSILLFTLISMTVVAQTRSNLVRSSRTPSVPALQPSFSEAVYPTGGTFAEMVAVGDLNGDGWPDLVVLNRCAQGFMSCLMSGSSVAVFLSSGGGGFSSPTTYSTGGAYAYAVAVADVNGDGKLDVVVENSFCASGPYYCVGGQGVLVGNGDGTLQPVYPYSGAFPPGTPSATPDFNGDGIPDSATANFCEGCPSGFVVVAIGNANGTFQPSVSYASGGYEPVALTVVDINGDGNLDILVANQCADISTCASPGATGSVGVLLGNGDGTFQPPLIYSTGGVGAESILAVDLNRDGKPDIVVANDCNSNGTCPLGGGTVGVLINTTAYIATSTTLVSSLNPSPAGQSVTFTATVKSNSGALPDGAIVTFKNGTAVLGTALLKSGTGSLTTATLPVGTFSITASYAFDGTYGASSAQLKQMVTAALRYPTWVSFKVNPNPSSLGQTITCTASVKSSHGPIPDGELMTFYSDAIVLGTAALTGGTATLNPSSVPANTHVLKAVYSGNAATFMGSSATVRQVVYGPPTYATLSSSLNPTTYGQRVTFTATVFSPLSAPTGQVKFMWDRYTIGSAPLIDSGGLSSTATLAISGLNVQNFPLVAVFPGDTQNEASTSDVMNQVVLQATSTATLTSSANPSSFGQAVTFTARVTSDTVVVKGPVTFTAGKTILGTAQLGGGKAVLSVASLPVGTTTVTATYAGDSNVGKSSASVTQTVR